MYVWCVPAPCTIFGALLPLQRKELYTVSAELTDGIVSPGTCELFGHKRLSWFSCHIEKRKNFHNKILSTHYSILRTGFFPPRGRCLLIIYILCLYARSPIIWSISTSRRVGRRLSDSHQPSTSFVIHYSFHPFAHSLTKVYSLK